MSTALLRLPFLNIQVATELALEARAKPQATTMREKVEAAPAAMEVAVIAAREAARTAVTMTADQVDMVPGMEAAHTMVGTMADTVAAVDQYRTAGQATVDPTTAAAEEKVATAAE